MRYFARYSIISFIIITSVFSYSQSKTFKALLIDENGSIVKGGVVVFPLKRDSIFFHESDNEHIASDTAHIDLSIAQNRVFYFYRGDQKSKILRINQDSADDQVHLVPFIGVEYYLGLQKKRLCPVCLKSNSLIPIVYGFPSKEMIRQATHNIIRLGGCLVYDGMPKLYCKKDDLEF